MTKRDQILYTKPPLFFSFCNQFSGGTHVSTLLSHISLSAEGGYCHNSCVTTVHSDWFNFSTFTLTDKVLLGVVAEG